MIRILIVDDQRLIREGIRSLLTLQPDFEVIGEAENGQIALGQVEQLHPDLVLMDVRMPIIDGVAATREICRRFPTVKVLMLSTFDQDDYVTQAMHYGAKGYLLKDTHPEILASTIRSVYQGHTHLGPGLFEKVMAQSQVSQPSDPPPIELPPGWSDLTAREKEVLKLLAQGSSNREIAQSLYISEKTVKNHITNIFSRLQLRDRVQAALMATTFLDFLE